MDTRAVALRYYAFQITNSAGLYLPVSLLYLQNEGFDRFFVELSGAVFNVAFLAIEMPAGYVDDRVGRRSLAIPTRRLMDARRHRRTGPVAGPRRSRDPPHRRAGGYIIICAYIHIRRSAAERAAPDGRPAVGPSPGVESVSGGLLSGRPSHRA